MRTTMEQPGPRVVHLDHCAAWSGGEIALLRLLTPLASSRPLVVLAEDGPLVEHLRRASIDVLVLPLAARTNRLSRQQAGRLPWRSVLDSLAYVWRLRRLLHEQRPDAVHCNSLKSGIYGCLAARLAGVPAVWHVRDRITEDYLPPRVVRLVRLMLLLLPTAILVNSRATWETLGVQVRRRRWVHVLPDPYRPERTSRPRTHPSATPVVALIGRLAPWKGQDTFLDALDLLTARGRPVRGRLYGAALFGETEYAAVIEARVAERGGLVTLESFEGDVGDVLAEVDLAVSASVIPEPFGQVVVEAIAHGVPVVVADRGGPAEIVAGDAGGLTYAAGEAGSLADTVERLLDDPGLYARLSEAGLRRAGDFDPDSITAEYAAFMRSVIDTAGGRSAAS